MPVQAPPNPLRSDIDVLKALSEQTELLRSQELCVLDPELAAKCGIALGDQIRLKRDTNNYAIYTVSGVRQEGSGNDDLRMGLDGRRKLGTSETMTNIGMYVGGDILRSYLSDAQAQSQGEFVERLDDADKTTNLIACAPHGGGIEPYTDRQAERVASKLGSSKASSWRCKGWLSGGGAHDRWHVEATRISRNSFPLLETISERKFTHCVCFHGWSSGGILIGGRGPLDIKQAIQAAINTAIKDPTIDVTIADQDDAFNGDDQANLVNWLTKDGAGGIQLEQSYVARSTYWQQIADAVASVFG